MGAVSVTPGADNTAYNIRWEREDGRTSSLTVTKIGSKWVRSGTPDDVTFDAATGKLTLTPDALKDNSTIAVTSKNGVGADTEKTHKAPVDRPLDPADSVTFYEPPQLLGALTIMPGADNTAYVVNYIKEDGSEASFTVQKNGNTWTIPNKPAGVGLTPDTGVVMLTPNEVKDTSLVTVVSKNGIGEDATSSYTIREDGRSDPISYELGTGVNAGGVTLIPGPDNVSYVVTYLREDGTETSFTVKKSGKQWTSTDKPADVQLDSTTGAVLMPASEIKDFSLMKITSNNGKSGDRFVPILIGEGAPQKLTVSLNSDTGISSTDKYTKDPVINVGKIPTGKAWQYTLDGGYTWQDGVVGQSSFRLPDNNLINGQKHFIRARVKGQNTTISDMLTMTYDHVAPSPTLARIKCF